MLILKNYSKIIVNKINETIKKFILEKEYFNSIGLYACPWSGWISICFNKTIDLEDTEKNCPDFEFVEY